jgi:hypothetical protein
MLSIGLWQWYINITITILHIIHRPAFYLKYDFPKTGFCPRLQIEPTQLGAIDIASLNLRTKATSQITNDSYWASLSKFHLNTETECSNRNVEF